MRVNPGKKITRRRAADIYRKQPSESRADAGEPLSQPKALAKSPPASSAKLALPLDAAADVEYRRLRRR